MIWFLIAALTYPNTDLISFKINQNLIFNTKQECVEYLKTYNQYVKAGMGEFVIYGLDPASFKNLALNFEQIKRYIEQQKEVILYYEEAVKPKEDKK